MSGDDVAFVLVALLFVGAALLGWRDGKETRMAEYAQGGYIPPPSASRGCKCTLKAGDFIGRSSTELTQAIDARILAALTSVTDRQSRRNDEEDGS